MIIPLSLFLIYYRLKQREDNSHLYNEREILDKQLNEKMEQLSHLSRQVENQTIDKGMSLRMMEIRVLDIYEDSNIKIPTDIIEELHRMGLSNEKEIFDYIENQRYFWKLENSKKPYKKPTK